MNLFSSVKILDLTRVFSGPFATRHFADFGAEVIKIEPIGGEDSRKFPPLKNGWSGYFELLNHNKKSMFLDLKNVDDLELFYNLCKNCDVLVENYSPSVKNKLKINYEIIKNINPNIIYASVNGISDNVERKYYDVIAQAESGLISLNGDKEDMKISTSIVDAFSGMKLAYAISSALYYREKTGKGQKINVSMKGSAFDLLEQNLIESSVSKKDPKKVGNMDNAIAPFGLFKTKDGSIVIAIGNDILWNILSNFMKSNSGNFDDSIYKTNKDRLKNIDKLKSEIENIFKYYKTEALRKLLSDLGIPVGAVKTMTGVIHDKENYKEGLLSKFKHSKVGNIVVSAGGIFFSLFNKEPYVESSEL